MTCRLGNQIHFGNVARRPPQIRVVLIVDDKNLSIESQLRQRLRERLRLVIGERKRVDDIELVVLQLEQREPNGEPRETSSCGRWYS